MPDPNIPDAFDVFTVVLLRRPADAPEMTEDELDALQARHLAYRAQLARDGATVANGPFLAQSDETLRGMSVFARSPEEAARLSAADPSVIAGRLSFEVVEWWVAAGSIAFPNATEPAGDRRSLPGD
ncbi:YciI family protein [Microbacterium sp. KNMS]